MFLHNLLLNENHPLHNRTLHISGTFKETEKPDIEAGKPDIEAEKPDIEAEKPDIEAEKPDIEAEKPDAETERPDIETGFRPKTAGHILKLREAFPGQTVFGRSDVMKVIDMKASRTSELLKEMAERRIIEPAAGHGKGKYRFRRREG